MGQVLVIHNFHKELSTWLNGSNTVGDKYFRKFLGGKGNGNSYSALYSISYYKVRSKEESGRYNAGNAIKKAVKFLTGMALLVPEVEATEDAYCELKIEIISVYNGIVRLKYDISVLNGSFFDKKLIRIDQLLDYKIYRHIEKYDEVLINENEQEIEIDLSELWYDDLPLFTINDVSFNDQDCILAD